MDDSFLNSQELWGDVIKFFDNHSGVEIIDGDISSDQIGLKLSRFETLSILYRKRPANKDYYSEYLLDGSAIIRVISKTINDFEVFQDMEEYTDLELTNSYTYIHGGDAIPMEAPYEMILDYILSAIRRRLYLTNQ